MTGNKTKTIAVYGFKQTATPAPGAQAPGELWEIRTDFSILHLSWERVEIHFPDAGACSNRFSYSPLESCLGIGRTCQKEAFWKSLWGLPVDSSTHKGSCKERSEEAGVPLP